MSDSIFRRDDDMDFNLSEDDEEDQDKERVDDSAMDLNSDDDEEDPHISGACDSLDEDDSPDW